MHPIQWTNIHFPLQLKKCQKLKSIWEVPIYVYTKSTLSMSIPKVPTLGIFNWCILRRNNHVFFAHKLSMHTDSNKFYMYVNNGPTYPYRISLQNSILVTQLRTSCLSIDFKLLACCSFINLKVWVLVTCPFKKREKLLKIVSEL